MSSTRTYAVGGFFPRCCFSKIGIVGALVLVGCTGAIAQSEAKLPEQGLVFNCATSEHPELSRQISDYLEHLQVGPEILQITKNQDSIVFTLKQTSDSAGTLNIIERPELEVTEEFVALPRGASTKAGSRTVLTVSKKEIALALLSPGRRTEFSGAACNVEALTEHIGLRQNTVAWAQSLEWHWPNGSRAQWNPKYWNRGNLVKGRALKDAVADAFYQQDKYGIGCYTAAKLVWAQAALDYFSRVRPSSHKFQEVEAQLMRDGDPLVQIEPGSMWRFESDATPQDLAVPGKLLHLVEGVSPKNMIPGDWVYFLNTDGATYQHTGYEGSNSIYLGRNKFSDYYNDNNHEYSFREKLHEVYQWRNHVFSASRDVAKVTPLRATDLLKLERTPEEGGLLLNYRAVPDYFGYMSGPAKAQN
jgi:hypothetical protein